MVGDTHGQRVKNHFSGAGDLDDVDSIVLRKIEMSTLVRGGRGS